MSSAVIVSDGLNYSGCMGHNTLNVGVTKMFDY